MATYNPQNDEPTLEDLVRRKELVKTVGNAIALCTPPHVFGIHGDWGAGKTSFLHQLHWYLLGDCPQNSSVCTLERAKKSEKIKETWGDEWKSLNHVTVVWFEAWRYQQESAPIVALLQEIRGQLSWYSKAIREGKKITEVAIRGALLSLEDLTKKIGFQASAIEKAGEKWESENLATRLPSHMIREHLEETLKKLLGSEEGDKPTKRLVVMVDDLDRCEPDAAYKLIEGIKIYLNLPSCVFVLGMNQRIIERGISRHFQDLKDNNDLLQLQAREYLEKICPDIWHLPMLTTDDQGKLITAWLTLDDISLGLKECLINIITEAKCLPANPRKIKAYCNVLQRFLKKAQLNSRDPDHVRKCKIIVFLACLYQFHHGLYRILEGNSDFYHVISKWAITADGASDAFHAELKKLQKTSTVSTDSKTATPEAKLQDSFADPAYGNPFRLQTLIMSLKEVRTPSDIVPYLLA